MNILSILIAISSISIVSFYWGIVLSLHLPKIHRWFDRKPFNCRPCLTFHLTWVLAAFFALICNSLEILMVGVLLAFILFLIVKYIDNKKVIK